MDYRLFTDKKGEEAPGTTFIELIMGKFTRIREVLIYSAFYLISFAMLENRLTLCHLLTSKLDFRIPFCKYFVIPYLLWFAYVGVTVMFFCMFSDNEKEYYRLSRTLCVGCTIFLAISLVFPNAQTLRPHIYGDGIFDRLVAFIYRSDTATNVFPSIHVFNSLACHAAWASSDYTRDKRYIRYISLLLCISIILSTVFLKQHTLWDVGAAFILFALCYVFYYCGIAEKWQIRHKIALDS